MNKICSKCKTEKSLDDFDRDKSRADGYAYCCKSCESIRHHVYSLNNKDKRNESGKKYYQDNRVKVLKRQKKYVEDNWEKRSKWYKQYYQDNIKFISNRNAIWRENNREHTREVIRNHYKNNKHMYRSKDAKRRAMELKAIPAWANLFVIDSFYSISQELRRITGKLFHVDHIIPLQGKNVCGLHVQNNLRVIPALLNFQKANNLGDA